MLDEDATKCEKYSFRKEKLTNFFNYWRISFFSICLFGAIQFIVLTTTATFVYTNGSWNNPQNLGYSFMWNYLSDLGSVYSISGELNFTSRILFTTAVTIVGLTEIMFSFSFAFFYRNTKLSKLRIPPLITGILYGLGYIVIGYLPVDIFFNLHTIIVYVACSLKITTICFYTLIILRDQNYPNFYAYTNIIYIGIFFLFVFFLVLSLKDILVPFLPTCIVGQKMTFYLEAILYIIQCIGAILLLSKKTEINNFSTNNNLLKIS